MFYVFICIKRHIPLNVFFCFADIDECANTTDNCTNGATCVNTIGGYMCDCQTGYEGVYCETGMF